MSKENIVLGIAILALILGGIGLVGGNQSELGGSRFPNGISADSTSPSAGQVRGTTLNVTGAATLDTSLAIGTNGTAVTNIITGTCNLTQGTTGSFTATTSLEHFCAVTGAASGDQVFVSLPVGAGVSAGNSGSAFGSFVVTGGYATTTDFIGVTLQNLTGAATSSYSQATTSVQYLIFTP